MDCNVDSVVLVVTVPGQIVGGHSKKLSAVPLGTTSEYCEDIVSTTELLTATIVCQKLECDCALAMLCVQCAATAEAATIIRCGLRGSVDINASSAHVVTATAHQHAATRQGK